MEIYEKVKGYLCDHVGNMVMPGSPVYDGEENIWRVPVLCRTEVGIFPVGEIVVSKDGEFLRIPTKEQMLKVLDLQSAKRPFLVYADKEDLERRGIRAVGI